MRRVFPFIRHMTTNEWTPQAAVPASIVKMLQKDSKYASINAFYHIVSLLKDQKRTGWLDRPIDNPEHIADHMYRMSIIAMSVNADALGNKPDLSTCVKIALVHDIAESLVGDIVPHDPYVRKAEKHRREASTVQYLSEVTSSYNPAFSKELVELWTDYEEQRTLEGTIVKDIDKYELLLQTFEYERKTNKKMDEFWRSRDMIKHVEIGKMADSLMDEREDYFSH